MSVLSHFNLGSFASRLAKCMGISMPKKNYSTRKNDNTYIYGNTVRKLAVAEPLEEPLKRQKQDREEKQKQRREQQRELQRAHRINLLYTAAVVGVVAVMFVLCIQYLQLQTLAQQNTEQAAKLEVQLNHLTEQNDMTELEINGNIDYNSILNTALNELGMVYPKKSQVIEYYSTESEYVQQYSDIPDAK